jgi:Ricin-type beta-trefoil lectin domain-like
MTATDSSDIAAASLSLQKLRIVTISRAGRLLDAHVLGAQDFNVVTREPQVNNTQRWLLTNLSTTSAIGPYTIQQVSTGRYLDAHVTSDSGFRVVTRPKQDNLTQRWFIESFGGGFARIRQRTSTGRILEAQFTPGSDFQVVTQNPDVLNENQEWRIADAELVGE